MWSFLQTLFGRARPTADDVDVLSTDQVWERAERLSRQVLHVSTQDAFQMLDRGELDGTVLEAELRMARFLADADPRRVAA